MKRAGLVKERQAAMDALMAAETKHLNWALSDCRDFTTRIGNEVVAWATAPSTSSSQPSQAGASLQSSSSSLADETAAERLGDYLYYSGRPAGAESVVYYRRKAPLHEGMPLVLL
jgi:hypothetical protein